MPTILLVEDDPACRLPLARLLQIEGYDVTHAADGLEGLQRLDEQKHDLVLLDLLMPRLDGVGFLERMRADPRHASLPVFLVTANHDPRMLNRARELGITEYLFKGDVPFMRMIELIKRTLGEPFTPVRRGRRPKNPQAQQADNPPGNGKAGHGLLGKPQRRQFEADDEDNAADPEFSRDMD